MKKKNWLWSMLAVMMVAMLSVGIVSCGKDDDDNGTGSSVSNSSVVGRWTGTNGTWNFTYVFNSNGTGTAEGTSKRGSKHLWQFTWSGKTSIRCKGPHQSVGFDGEVTSDTWDSTFTLSGNTLSGVNIVGTLTRQ